jgi:phage shock protein PspC (stress-responsive transcriptional regulator)
MNTTPPEAPPPPPAAGPRVSRDEMRDLGRLRRSTTDRKVAGVAGGLGRHLDVDPLVLRVAFVVLVFFGGAGLILYGAAWLLVPEDGSDRAPVNLDDRTRTVALLIVGAIAALALVGDSWGAFGFPWPLAIVALVALWLLTRNSPPRDAPPGAPTAAGPAASAYDPQQYAAPQAAPAWAPPAAPANPYAAPAWTPPPAPPYVPPVTAYVRPSNPRKRGPILFWFTLALVVLSEGLLGIADVAGAPVADAAYPALAVAICGVMLVVGAFFGRAGGIIALGLVAALGLAGATAAHEVDADSVTEHPLTAAEVAADGYDYSLGVGEQRLDFSGIADLEALDGRTIAVHGDAGSIDITVPQGAYVRVVAQIDGPGEIKLFGADRNGWGVEDSATAGRPSDPYITLDVELGFGTIEVTH